MAINWLFRRLAIGSLLDAESQPPVTSILGVCEQRAAISHQLVRYVHLPFTDDMPIPDNPPVLDIALAFLRESLERGETVLVHCHKGRSRSAALLTAYGYSIGMSLHEAFTYIQQHRPAVRWSIPLMQSVEQYFVGKAQHHDAYSSGGH